jgi:multiple sugar transport system ATP-binding protein
MAEIVLDQVSKCFSDGTAAVKDVSLTIADGEFFVLVGPSGCGKSTLLNMIVGLEDVSQGEIRVDGQRVNDVDPRDRNMAMVFQSYALYPHMTVRENMAFPLKLARLPRDEINKRVKRAADILELGVLLERKPGSLSGGQRQRVAMGRALVREPRAFLLDEPLSNLDAKLRVQMRTEIARLQQRLGITTLYVTHDQTEAMTLGDRIAILRRGAVQQVGTPRELYEQPCNLFVAGFVGSPAMNFFPAELREHHHIQLPMGQFSLSEEQRRRLPTAARTFIAGIRPEHLQDATLSSEASEQHLKFRARVDLVEWLGAELLVHFEAEGVSPKTLPALPDDIGLDTANDGDLRLVARIGTASAAHEGRELELSLDLRKLQLFDPHSGECVLGPLATDRIS